MIIQFEVPGYCQPKQRTFGKRFITPPKTRTYENLVKLNAELAKKYYESKYKEPTKAQYLFSQPVQVEIYIACLVPKSWSKKSKDMAMKREIYPTSSDIDNCAKSILDGMNKIIYEDDRQIWKLSIMRIFDEREFVRVTIRDKDG